MCQCEFMLILMKGCCANCGRLLSARLISAKSLSAEEEEDIDVARERRRLYEGGAQDDLLKICDLTKVLCAVYLSSCRSTALTMRHFCYSVDSFMFFGSDVDRLLYLFLCSLSCVSCVIFLIVHGNKSNTERVSELCPLTFVNLGLVLPSVNPLLCPAHMQPTHQVNLSILILFYLSILFFRRVFLILSRFFITHYPFSPYRQKETKTMFFVLHLNKDIVLKK